MLVQTVQIVGALLVLAGFLGVLGHRTDEDRYPYLLANLAGSGAMGATAVVTAAWGFVFLEVVWALVSAWGIAVRLRGHAAAGREGRA